MKVPAFSRDNVNSVAAPEITLTKLPNSTHWASLMARDCEDTRISSRLVSVAPDKSTSAPRTVSTSVPSPPSILSSTRVLPSMVMVSEPSPAASVINPLAMEILSEFEEPLMM